MKHHKHSLSGRGVMDILRAGRDLSNKYQVGAKLAASSDPRLAMAGKVLKAVGGRKHHARRRHHRR